jgi:hypothetical protein
MIEQAGDGRVAAGSRRTKLVITDVGDQLG